MKSPRCGRSSAVGRCLSRPPCRRPPPRHSIVTTPGPHAQLPEAAYHNDPVPGGSLSSTGARKLLPPGCPAKYRWWADNREPFKAVFEEGKAAHRKVLGVGPELVLVDRRERWDTNDDKKPPSPTSAPPGTCR
jgi:hypothetical protein